MQVGDRHTVMFTALTFTHTDAHTAGADHQQRCFCCRLAAPTLIPLRCSCWVYVSSLVYLLGIVLCIICARVDCCIDSALGTCIEESLYAAMSRSNTIVSSSITPNSYTKHTQQIHCRGFPYLLLLQYCHLAP